jgi:hypothetical protein
MIAFVHPLVLQFMNRWLIPFLHFLITTFAYDLSATIPVNTEDIVAGEICMYEMVYDKVLTKGEMKILRKEERKLLRTEKRMERFQRLLQSPKIQQRIGGLNDPVDRWFWFWIGGWGIGLLLTILTGGMLASGGIGILWFLFFVAGSVSLVVWLLKKFG